VCRRTDGGGLGGERSIVGLDMGLALADLREGKEAEDRDRRCRRKDEGEDRND
jgi:hypothetical protein